MANELTRRDVLRGSAVVVAGLAMGTAIAEGPQEKQKSNRLRFGIIGCGGKGESGMAQAAEHGDIVAVCDVDVTARTKALTLHPKASSFDDYRFMLEAMKGKLDAVVISTPDHHHAIASALAMRQDYAGRLRTGTCRGSCGGAVLADRTATVDRTATRAHPRPGVLAPSAPPCDRAFRGEVDHRARSRNWRSESRGSECTSARARGRARARARAQALPPRVRPRQIAQERCRTTDMPGPPARCTCRSPRTRCQSRAP